MQEKRLIIALVISSAILFLWTYLSPVKPPQPNQNTPQSTASPSSTQTTTSTPSPGAQQASSPTAAQPSSQAPQRTITIRTPLYITKFDTRGAEPISWIISKNKNGQKDIFSVAGVGKELELISPKGLEAQPRQVPLQLQTGDAATDYALATSTYDVDGVEGSGDVDLNLGSGETKEITFSLDQNGVRVKKKLKFNADQYATDMSISLMRGAEALSQVRMTIGPSIGDQGVEHHTFYSVAPEGIAFVNDRIERHPAAGINSNKNSPDKLTLNGPVDWAGVGDTYFAMVAVPGQRTQGLEYRTVAYEYKSKNGSAEKRYLTTALVPILTDGSDTVVYAGPKDHYLLTTASSEVSAIVKRPLDLEPMIDYGWLAWLSRPLAVPILKCITYLFRLTSSYGVAIILFTIGVYSLFFPLKWRSSKAMKKAQKMAPKMKELQEKIKGMKQSDPRLKELQMEQLRLMKEGNPLGGCLPLLIQMPFLFALYRAITISLDFRQAPFLWLGDLSSGDPKHILEFMMAGTMIVLQLITPAPSADPVQRKMMAIGMPLMMLYVLWGAPSGLLLYWLVGNIVGFSQQFVINRFTKSEDDEPPAQPSGTGGRKKPADPVVSRA